MFRASLLRSVGLRFALLYTGAFMASVAVVGWITVVAVTRSLEAQAAARVIAEANALVEEFKAGGQPDLDAALAGRLADQHVHYFYAATDAAARVRIGDPRLARDVAEDGTVSPGSEFAGAAVAIRRLGDGSRVVVADDLSGIREVRAVLTWAFAVALGLAAALGLGTGALLTAALLTRLGAFNRTAAAVVAGDLSRRVARTGSGDEFDRLAVTLNGMLDRIDGLMGNLRQVSNDIAHDLRTPLSRLRQELEAAVAHSTTVEDFRSKVSQAIGDVDAILDIFAALLRISQVEAGSRRSAFKAVNLSEVAATVADAYRPAVEDAGRALRCETAGHVSIEGDQELLVQLFANLLENALRHGDGGREIAVRVGERDGRPFASVRDDGPGIPEGERDRVLRRFYRLERSRSTAGAGLGLSLVAAVADLHGARLTLSDNRPGLCALIQWPRRAAANGVSISAP